MENVRYLLASILFLSAVCYGYAGDFDRTPKELGPPVSSPLTKTDFLLISDCDWSVNAQPSVIDRQFNKKDVALFEEQMINDPGEANDLKDTVKEEEIGDFRWVDIDKDGSYELVVTVGTPGRLIFNATVIYKQYPGKKYLGQNIFVFTVQELDGVIQDLDNDCYPELVLPLLLSSYRGARPTYIWPAVFKWNGSGMVDASKRFPAYYKKNVLPRVLKEIDEAAVRQEKYRLEVLSGKTRDTQSEIIEYARDLEEDLAVQQMIRDRISRLSGDNPTAGLALAKEWAKSKNENLREDAVLVFGEIRNKESLTELFALTRDPNSGIADMARDLLFEKSK
jgi:hypothetical protein